jgi:hypothetical protein
MNPDGTILLDTDFEYLKQKDIVYEYIKVGGTLISPFRSSEGNEIYMRNRYYYLM